MAGRVESIHIGPEISGPLHSVERVRALAGRGLEGDRKFADEGDPSHAPGEGSDLTLIEAEAIEGLARDTGIDLGPSGPRRQVVTRGIGLNDLVGRRFRVGAVQAVGVELCDPCRHLERITEDGMLKGLVNRGGLRADILEGGEIGVGDEVEDLGPAE
jgi:MOSC domain-containing protein YiiM